MKKEKSPVYLMSLGVQLASATALLYLWIEARERTIWSFFFLLVVLLTVGGLTCITQDAAKHRK
ncbi:hypothetical protein [Streptomyces sp. GSL17-111]|uniref:hypothetical protein n=1 Tax=Streptomyces sp. GSL17-111 TaxID=3121596 RepID=UPI0030F467A8